MKIKMEHGAGGEIMERFIKEIILENIHLRNAGGIGLDELDDGATVPVGEGHLVFTIDGHTVKPLFFPGGDIGKLSVSGTVNDLAVMGAKPLALANALILEAGTDADMVKKIIASMDEVSREVPVPIIAGDTKVVDDKIGVVIATAGIGMAEHPISDAGSKLGDAVIVSGTVGQHGMAIICARESIKFESEIKSDVGPVWNIVKSVADAVGWEHIHAMKDPTRGGISMALNEMARKSGYGVEIKEEDIPVSPEVRAAGEMLGISPFDVACEGRVVMVVDKDFAEEALNAIQKQPNGKDAAIIGKITDTYPKKVVLETVIGGKRFLEPPIGDPVPRVC